MSGVVSRVTKGKRAELPEETVFESGIPGRLGIALARIVESKPHFHNRTTEWYMVTKGAGTVYLDGRPLAIRKHDVVKIPPKTVHFVTSSGGVELYVVTMPPWRKSDHHLVDMLRKGKG